VRYDAAIIGAGADGLAAAATLAARGLKVVVLERAASCGGRCATREFHPGFRASPYCDEIAPIPAGILRSLELARHGAIFSGAAPLPAGIEAIRARGLADTAPAGRSWFARASEPKPWPCRELFRETLDGRDKDAVADALAGRAADPALAGSALHSLIGRSGIVMGGLGTLAKALEASARKAGVEIMLGLEVADIHHAKQRVSGVRLADGTVIEASAVISTLDLRRTFFSLFAWKDLPKPAIERVSAWRHAAGRARLLIALDEGLSISAPLRTYGFAQAHAAWRAGAMPEHPPLVLTPVSAADPSLAPGGKAVMTATLGFIPHHLFDGAWTHEKRTALEERARKDIEALLPGLKILATTLIVPPDIEEALGVTEGDLDGGEIAPDQMFALRGFEDHPGGRTPIAGLYLGGRSSPLGPFATCAAGVAAAHAAMADLA
jgi:phytoene dehydrogenase-like protein